MNTKERYYWDITGYFVLRSVLSAEDLQAANEAVDAHAGNISPGEANRLSRGSQALQGSFRKMLTHPQIVSRLQVMCGTGFRLDHGPQFIGGIKGTSGHAMHGAGEPHKPVVFFMDGAQAHGTFPWRNEHERRSILFKFASRTSAPSGPASQFAPPESYWDNKIFDGMTEEQLAVMWGPYSNYGEELPLLDVDDEDTVYVANKAEQQAAD